MGKFLAFKKIEKYISLLRAKKNFLILTALVLAIPLTLYLTSQEQIFQQSAASKPLALSIVGNHLVDANGQKIRLFGINRVASDCVKASTTIFVGPFDQASVVALTKWHINTVRITMNEDCWLGINNAPTQTSGANYRNAITQYVKLLHTYGMYAIVDLHMNAPGTHLSVTQQTMADADHAPAYWTSVANTFKNDPAVIFEPYNEPDITLTNAQTTNPWDCWLHGCTVKYLYSDFYTDTKTPLNWQTTGMQQLVNAIRATGATNVISLGGLATSHDLTHLLQYLPTDPKHQLAATFHNYERGTLTANGCGPSCWDSVIAPIAQQMPIITDEFGDTECQTNYAGFVTQFMNWADQHGVSYLPWGWFVYTGTPTSCSGTHQYNMLSKLDGTPNYYGKIFFDHFAQVNPGLIPSITSIPTISKIPSQPPKNCQPNGILVNPCRPWVGAAASGNPGIPGQTPPGKDGVSQFEYLEKLIGRPLDIYRQYHSYPGSTTGPKDQPLSSDEITLANRTSTNTYVDVNWTPASTFKAALPVSKGGDPAINANIDKVAASIKSVAPHKVFLSLWHETNLLVSSADNTSQNCSVFSSGQRAYGSPDQFNAAWQNVYNHFKSDGVTNVIWVMNYLGDPKHGCWVPYLWPGNQYVDWVLYDSYLFKNGDSWNGTAGTFYKLLEASSSAAVNFKSKPWGIGEFGYCNTNTSVTAEQYFQQIKTALDQNAYPRLKMYLIYANSGKGGIGCLTDYDANGTYDQAKQDSINKLFNDPILLGGTITPTVTPSVSASPHPTVSQTPSSSPSPGNGETTFSLTVCPHGLGNCGDNSNPTSGGGNTNPKHPTRQVTLTFFKTGTLPLATSQGTVTYQPTAQNFQGTVSTTLPSGAYIVKLSMNGYLTKQFTGIFTIKPGLTLQLPEISLIAGNVNNDTQLDILDWNIITDLCFDTNATSSSCPNPITDQDPGADINDDGVVDIADANLYFREIAVQNGAGGGQPTPTITISQTPSVSPSPTNCQPNAILVNPCRPWVGAAANGNPGVPGQTPVGKDKISQFTYLESLVGRPLDIFRDYDGSSTPPLNSNELHFANRPNTSIDINWAPAGSFLEAMPVSQGGNAATNATIDKVAANFKTLGSQKKIFLSLWHETNLKTGGGTCSGGKTGLGTAGQYVAAYQNVWNHFKADGVSNVVWVMNYSSDLQRSCFVTPLWPGNQYVDWVIYDTYSRGKTFDQTAGAFYQFLMQQSSATVNFASKPWGIGEFGTCKQPTTGITDAQYYQSVKAALDGNTYPKLKMYLVYADTGNNSGPGCLTDYDANGQYDPQKQTVFNQLFNDPLLKQ